jgi:hypothetical protein
MVTRFLLLLTLCTIACADESIHYPLSTIEAPSDLQLEVSGLAALPDGRMAMAIRKGEVWIYDPTDNSFNLFASGLHEPLGLTLHKGDLYTCQRTEVTRLRDTDNDGIANGYFTYAKGWGVSGNYHEYAYGPVFDPGGNMYITLNCSIGKKVIEHATAWRGWSMMKSPGGTLHPVSGGMRSPIGIGLNHLGDVFGTDHQGNWFPTCPLYHIKPGVFHGHADALKSCALPGATFTHPGKLPSGLTVGEAAKQIEAYTLPAVWFPYKKTAMGTTGMICDTTAGKFGPFTNQLFVGEFTLSNIHRVFLEKVGGEYQGAVFPFRNGFQSAVLCLEFDRNGHMYVGESNRGWNSVGARSYGLQRLDYKTLPFEIQRMEAHPRGFKLTLTEPIDPDTAVPQSFSLSSYTYLYSSAYGGDEIDVRKHRLTVSDVAARALILQVDKLRPTYVYELHAEGLRSASGEPLLHTDAYYTLNHLCMPPE